MTESKITRRQTLLGAAGVAVAAALPEAGPLFDTALSPVQRLTPVKSGVRALVAINAVIVPPPNHVGPEERYRIEASPDALICQPGDLIIIETDLGEERAIVTELLAAAI